jgi:hypothetical protein
MLSRMLRFAILLAVVAAIVEAIRRLAQPEAPDTSPAPTPWTPLEPRPGQDNGAGSVDAGASPPLIVDETADAVVEPVESGGHQQASEGESTPWVDADDDGACPVSHPLKAKDSSKIVHQPGGLSYDRTHADRCYVDLASAEADGYRAAKR